MFGRHHMIKQLAGGFAIVAVAAVVAASSASAGTNSSDRTRDKSCQGATSGWITITDDLGTAYLVQSPQTDCTTSIACTSTPQTPNQAPPTGWVSIVDDLGIPYLYPVGQTGASVTPAACVLALNAGTTAAPVASAKASAKKSKPSAKKTKSASMNSRFRHAESVTR